MKRRHCRQDKDRFALEKDHQHQLCSEVEIQRDPKRRRRTITDLCI
jgi:hypothetical protein